MPHCLEDYCFVRLQGFHLIFSSECPIWHSPYTQETRIQSLDREYPLEKATATHSSIPAWRIPWTEGAGKNRYDYKLILVSVRWKLKKYLEKIKQKKKKTTGFSWWLKQWRICLQCQRPGFNPWVGNIPWRRKRQPTLVPLPRELHGQRRLTGYSPRDPKESDRTESDPQNWLVSRSFMNNVALWWPEIFRLASWMCKRYTYITVYLKITSKF